MKQHVDWLAEIEHSQHGHKVLRISATRGDDSEFYDLGIAEAIEIVQLDSTSQIESVSDDIAGRFDPPIPVPEGEVGERFWENVYNIATRWVAEEAK